MSEKHEEGKHHRRKHHQHGGGGHEEAHEGAPEWLISFADNVVLQMGFFVILLAMNLAIPSGGADGDGEGGGSREEAMLDFAIAVRESFNNPLDMTSTRPEDAALIRRMRQREERASGEASERGPEGDDQNVQSVRPSGYSSIGGRVSFVDHSAAISETEHRRAMDVGQRIAGLRWIVEVRGHVSAAESFREGGRGWKLSNDRAMAVKEVLIEAGVEERQIRVVACGDTEPLQVRAYEPGEQRTNQRVEIVVTDRMATGER